MYKLIHRLNVEDNWGQVAPWIAVAVGAEPHHWQDIEYIKVQAMQGLMKIWTGHDPATKKLDLVMVTEDHLIGGKPVLVCRWLSAERFDDKMFDFSLVEAWAKEQGYHRLQIWGRPGWARKLKPLGFTTEFVVITKDVDRGIH